MTDAANNKGNPESPSFGKGRERVAEEAGVEATGGRRLPPPSSPTRPLLGSPSCPGEVGVRGRLHPETLLGDPWVSLVIVTSGHPGEVSGSH